MYVCECVVMYIFTVLHSSCIFCEQVWALDRGCFQTIMMNTGIIRQSEYLKFLKRYMGDGVSINLWVFSSGCHNCCLQ